MTENENTMQQVKTLLASTQKDKVELANQLEEEKRYASLHGNFLTTSFVGTVTSVMFVFRSPVGRYQYIYCTHVR